MSVRTAATVLRALFAVGAAFAGSTGASVGAPASAHSLVGPSWNSPAVMVREEVRVTVGPGLSLVEGAHRFVFVPRFSDHNFLKTVVVKFPVFAAATTTDATEVLEQVAATVRVREDEYPARRARRLAPEVFRTEVDLPIGAAVWLLEFDLPRDRLGGAFMLHTRHRQPHLDESGREVVAHLPLLPDFEDLLSDIRISRHKFVVTFLALEGVRLGRVSLNQELTAETAREIVVQARHEETIVVGVTPGT